jgi:hypothetical protein
MLKREKTECWGAGLLFDTGEVSRKVLHWDDCERVTLKTFHGLLLTCRFLLINTTTIRNNQI